MILTGETKLFLGIIIATFVIVVGGIFFFSKPAPLLTKEDLIPQGTYTTGNPNAKVFLVEFSDFQCPACKAFQPTVHTILEKYKDQLLFAYRHFPLDQHPFAQHAARTAEAAGIQGKFWEMHDLLFENQEQFSDAYFPQVAGELKLDMNKFTQSLSDENLKNKIERDRAYGVKIGVDATPTFYLQGKKLSLLSPADLLKEVENAITTVEK
jgi:protein-disulfide isomerase